MRRKSDNLFFLISVDHSLLSTPWIGLHFPIKQADGDGVVMDNLRAQGEGICEIIQNADARLLYLPPYSPDLSPIETAFAKLKTLLRGEAKHTGDALQRRPGAWRQLGLLGDLYYHAIPRRA